MAKHLFRIFVSSPGDVSDERKRVDHVVARLASEYCDAVRFEVIRWEESYYSAARSFQDQIPPPSETDLVVCIFWKRLGSELPDTYRRPDDGRIPTGTEYEFEDAIRAARERGTPDILVYRKTARVLFDQEQLDLERTQFEALTRFWQQWFVDEGGHFTAGYHSFETADEFEEQLEGHLRRWLEHRGVALTGPVWDRHVKGSPFLGLAPFDVSHAPVFFGREAAISKALGRLRQGAPFLLLIGASGSGKSSLLRAGLLPRVARLGTIPDVDQWRTAVVLPTADPLLSLAEALYTEAALGTELREGDFRTPQLLAGLLAAGGDAAVAPIRRALERAAEERAKVLGYDAPRSTLLLIGVDQVERLFVEAQPGKVEAFAGVLHMLVRHKLAVVIAALRSDAYGSFQGIAPLVALREEGGATLDLLPPSAQELEEIVTKPVAACQPPLAFETDHRGHSLAEILVSDAKGGDALPLLQMSLERLFQAEAARGDGMLRFSDYPGMDKAVTETAEEVFAGLNDAARASLPALLTTLVHDVDIDPGTDRITLTLVPAVRRVFEHGRPERRALVDAFIARRLLTSEEAAGTVQVRPVHEALLRAWPEAVRILRENAALIRVRHTLVPMVAEWSRAKDAEKADHLATSAALLAGAAQLAERMGDDLSPEMRAFVEHSLAADARRRDAESRRQRRVLAATAAGLVIALVLAGLAGWQWHEAESARRAEAEQRGRAERALAAATRTANALVFDLAQELRSRAGMPVDLVRNILDRAQGLQRQLLESGEAAPDLRRSEAVALGELVVTLVAQGDTKEALAAAQRSRDVLEALAAADPGNSGRQGDLAIGYNNLGDVLIAAGRREAALDSYRKSLAIAERLSAADPGNTEWPRDLAVAHSRIGNVLIGAGRREEALESYRKSLVLRETLTAAEPGNAEWQRDLAVDYNKVGDALVGVGQYGEALDSYRKGFVIAEKLAAADPGNAEWQHDVSIGHERIGDALLAAGRREEALESYRKSLVLRETLTAADPGNAGWQHDLSVGYNKVGDVSAAAGRRGEALDAYRKSLAIFEKLAAADPGNVGRRTELVASLWKAAQAGDDARGHLMRALSILRQLDAEGRLTARQKDWIPLFEQVLASVSPS